MTIPPTLREGFRQSMRRVASGVSLVTTGEVAHDDRPATRFGIAMTAFMSLSFDPPSLVIAVNRGASIHKPLLRIGAFCVNVLAQHQEQLCQDFAMQPSDKRFDVGDWASDEGGLPYLPDAQTNIVCAVAAHHGFGSHDLIVGLVERVTNHTDIVPLVFADGRYGRIAAA
ncbi:MAG: flavin reductase family protein [Sphingomonadales bacterium]|nr:flavin reductase family protein [Sphingomonadales bacterium]MDE2170867.1 flavin reductase family protein [Sphingomonadales bacterium]